MITEINIKNDLPSADIAIFRIEQEIEVHKQFGNQIIKIVHGYGSSGQGGKIKNELNRLLPIWKKQNKIYDFIKGESFTEITIQSKKYPKKLKEYLTQELYFSHLNKGTTFLILRENE